MSHTRLLRRDGIFVFFVYICLVSSGNATQKSSVYRHTLFEWISVRTTNFCLVYSARKRWGVANCEELSISDWEGVVQESLAHGVAAILYDRLKRESGPLRIPSEMLQRLKAVKLRIGIRNTKLYHELAGVLKALRKEGIQVIVLKGAHLAELAYGNVALRPMDDVDILVKKHDLSRAEKKFFEMGYFHLEGDSERMKSASPHHLTPFRKQGCTPIEVHWTLPSMDTPGTDANNVWERAQDAEIAGSKALVLSPEDLLLHISIHASLHHRFGVGLRPLCDISAILTRYRDVLDWNKVLSSAQQWGLCNGVYLTLHVAKELIDADVPESALQALKAKQFDAALIDWAKEQIYTLSGELTDPSSMSPRLAQFWGSRSLTGKVKQLLRVAFPPPGDIARAYNLASDSLRLYFFYPIVILKVTFSPAQPLRKVTFSSIFVHPKN